MEPYEAAALLANHDLIRRDAWERTRVLAYITAQANSTEKLRPSDVLPLPWDDDAGGPESETLTAGQRETLAAMAKQMEETLNNGK